MKQTKIKYRDLDFFSDLFKDYIDNKTELKPFYKYEPSIKSFAEAIEVRRNFETNRQLLSDVFIAQSSNAGELSKKNIELLKHPNTFTITTGHQLNIFTGPLYFIYKIITIIKMCNDLKKAYPENNFVPVYWMNSDDHDFEEISYIHLFGREIRWNLKSNGPTGAISTESMPGILDEVFEMMGSSENAVKLKNILEKAYHGHQSLNLSMRFLVDSLFGKYGLLILDPSDKALKAQFKSIIRDDIFHSNAYKLVNETAGKMAEKYKVQVNPRELNVFYMEEDFRERIVRVEKDNEVVYEVLNRGIQFSEHELNIEIETHPEKFSPNVVLRPMYQEMILPNLAYIGGPSEIAYWLEYKSMFEHYQINFPVLVPRNTALWVDDSQQKKMKKSDMQIIDFFLSQDQIAKKYVLTHGGGDLNLQNETERIEKIFDEIIINALQIDPTLKATIEGEKQKHIKSMQYIADKLIKAQKRKLETDISQLQNIKEKLFPSGNLQERYDNFIPYYIKYGESFFDTLLENFNPFEKSFLLLEDQKF